MAQEAQSSRRDVLKQGAVLTAGLAVLGPVLASCESPKKKEAVITRGVVNIGKPSDYSAGSVSLKWMQLYGIAVAKDTDAVLAILPKCTHKGCAVPWVEDRNQFVCPCHGSRFSLLGQVLEGPAKKPLPAVTAAVEADGTLTVDLDKLYALVA